MSNTSPEPLISLRPQRAQYLLKYGVSRGFSKVFGTDSRPVTYERFMSLSSDFPTVRVIRPSGWPPSGERDLRNLGVLDQPAAACSRKRLMKPPTLRALRKPA
jgi:hypothetical protein